MPTPPQDPLLTPGCYVFGYSLPGSAYWGRARLYLQVALWGSRPFGGEIPGLNAEDEFFRFLRSTPNPKKPYYKNRVKKTSPVPWGPLPVMSCRHVGVWGKRAIMYMRSGTNVIRRYTPYDGSAKNSITPWMLKLLESSFIWSLFDDATKKRLTDDARESGGATQGHNYFTKLYITDNPKWLTYV